MTNEQRLAHAKALFDEAVAAIDKRVEETQASMLRKGYAALLRGDTAERDRLCSPAAQAALRRAQAPRRQRHGREPARQSAWTATPCGPRHLSTCRGPTHDPPNLSPLASSCAPHSPMECCTVSTIPEFPNGAIHNGREFFRRVEEFYDFECEGGPLKNCVEWQQAKDCFEYLVGFAELVSHDIAELLADLDDEAGTIRVGDDASCPICTLGTVPYSLDKGPCASHRLIRMLGTKP